jgi:hypothetical protein
MSVNNEEQQREEFRNILLDLAKSQELLENNYELSNMYKRLEALYRPDPGKEFRHYYSDIFSILIEINNNVELGDLNILGQNLQLIMAGYQAVNYRNGQLVDASASIKKLYDHVNLDISRITYWDSKYRSESGIQEVTELKGQVNALQITIKEAQEKQKRFEKTQALAEQKLDNSQKEYITILGIFSAVVLAFIGGITFSTSVLNNIAQASIYRIVLISLIIGLVFINIIFSMFYYINKFMVRRARIWPMIISNIVFVVLLGVTVLSWNFGWVESRNSRVHESESSVAEAKSSTNLESTDQNNFLNSTYLKF